MNTFLPYPEFDRSAACLDMKRLGKQRVEVLQLLQALLGITEGWKNHPAALMWKGHENSLNQYGCMICREWHDVRKFKDTVREKIEKLWIPGQLAVPPSWVGNPDFHAAHRSNLLRKDAVWYGQFGWTEPATLPYVWPVKKNSLDS
jgi:hypothetical protein